MKECKCPVCHKRIKITKEDRKGLFVECPNMDCPIKEFFYDMVIVQ